MKPSMLAKLDQLANRLVELDELLMHEGATSNMDSYRKMTREHAEIGPLVALYKDFQRAQAEAIIETRVQSFMHWIDDRAMVPVIQDLQENSEAMRLFELERARKMLARGEDVEAVLEALSKGLTAKFLHGPQQALHRAQGDERARLASLLPQLFRGRR